MTDSRTAIYVRQSLDRDSNQLAVERQREDLLRLCAERGWGTPVEYIDNSVSATKGVRPAYRDLCEAIAAGTVTKVAVWDLDRLHRQPAELEEFMKLVDTHRVELASVGGDVDLSTEQGKLVARMKGSVAAYEIGQMVRRKKRANRQKALRGNPWVGRPFGYTARIDLDAVVRRAEQAAYNKALAAGLSEADAVQAGVDAAAARRDAYNPATDSTDNEIVPREAEAIRQGCQDLLDGVSLMSIARQWNEAGLTTVKGYRWTGGTVKQVLVRPRNAGLVVYDGQILEGVEAKWPSIIERDTLDAVLALLADPKRHSGRKQGRVNLLTGIAICGKCEHAIGSSTRTTKRPGVRRAVYVCKNCGGITRDLAKTDKIVVDAITTVLAKPDAAQTLTQEPGVDVEAARAELEGLRGRLAATRALWVEDKISDEDWLLKGERLRGRIEAVQSTLVGENRSRQLDGLVGQPDAAERFKGMGLDRRRAVVRALVRVTLAPSSLAGGFDRDSVVVDWL